MKPVFDTNVFLEHRHKITESDLKKMALSVIVLYELTATTIDKSDLKRYETWRKQFDRDGLLLVPTTEDWWEVAKAVSRIRHGEKSASHGKTPPDPQAQRLQNDALIARTAQMNDCFVVTANLKDFSRLRPYMKFKVVSAKEYFDL